MCVVRCVLCVVLRGARCLLSVYCVFRVVCVLGRWGLSLACVVRGVACVKLRIVACQISRTLCIVLCRTTNNVAVGLVAQCVWISTTCKGQSSHGRSRAQSGRPRIAFQRCICFWAWLNHRRSLGNESSLICLSVCKRVRMCQHNLCR